MALTSGATHTLQWPEYNGLPHREVERILKAGLSWNCRLQLACMNVELLVTADQPYCGEYVPGPCTHRPSRHGSR